MSDKFKQLAFDFTCTIGESGDLQAGNTSEKPKRRGRPPKTRQPTQTPQPKKPQKKEGDEPADNETDVVPSKKSGTLHKCPSCGAWVGEKCGWCKPKAGRPKKK